jgi:hypothetical protein
MVDNMAFGGGGLPGNGMGGVEAGKRGIDDGHDVHTLGFGKHGGKGGDGDDGKNLWLEKGFEGDGGGEKGDDKKDDKDGDKKKVDGNSTFDMSRPDEKNIPKPAGNDKSTQNAPATTDKPAASDKPEPDTNNSNTFFNPAAEKGGEELALALALANNNKAEVEGVVITDDLKKPVERRSGCAKHIDAECKACQSSFDTYQDCLCDRLLRSETPVPSIYFVRRASQNLHSQHRTPRRVRFSVPWMP